MAGKSAKPEPAGGRWKVMKISAVPDSISRPHRESVVPGAHARSCRPYDEFPTTTDALRPLSRRLAQSLSPAAASS
jgi:hypothetical protein